MEAIAPTLYLWMLIGMRTTGVLLFIPGMPGKPWPPMLRVALSAGIALLLCNTQHRVLMPPTVGHLIITVAGEFALGMALGFISRMAFYTMEMAGRVIGTQIGMTAAPGVDSPTFDQEPVAGALQVLAQSLFFVCGCHLWVIAALAQTFSRVPAGMPAVSPDYIEVIANLTGAVIEGGVKLAAPFMLLNILVHLAFGFLGKVAPKINVFVLSFSVVNLAGLFLLSGAGMLFAHYLFSRFTAIPDHFSRLLPVLP